MPVIGFGVPIHESVEGATFDALSLTWAAWRDVAPADWRLKVRNARGCSIVENRNRIAAALLEDGFALPDGTRVPGTDAPRSPLSTRAADVVVWCDSDCLVAPEEFVRLVQSLLDAGKSCAAVGYGFPIQSGDDHPRPNCGRDPPYHPGHESAISFNAGRADAPPCSAPVQLVRVDWIGFGAVATRAAAYHEMSYAASPSRGATEGPWFSHVSGKNGRGEDIGWCRDARALGFSILCDVGVLGTHCYRGPHRLDDYYAKHHREG